MIQETRIETLASTTRPTEPIVLVNPNAGGLRRRGVLEAITRAVGTRGRLLVTRDESELDRAATEIVAAKTRAVLFCGGDGTYHSGITALSRAARGAPLPPIAFARAGTVSIVARNWGSPRNIVDAVHRVLGPRESWTVTTRPTLQVSEAGGASRVGFTFGTGLVANFFEEYDKAETQGNAAAAAIIARLFVGGIRRDAFARRVLEPTPCRLTVDGARQPATAYSLVLSSVLKDVGLHHWVAYRAGEDLQRPHLVALTLPTRGLALAWPRVLFGKHVPDPKGVDRLAMRIDVEFTGGPGPYVLDGDTFRADEVTVSAGPVIQVVT